MVHSINVQEPMNLITIILHIHSSVPCYSVVASQESNVIYICIIIIMHMRENRSTWLTQVTVLLLTTCFKTVPAVSGKSYQLAIKTSEPAIKI